MKFKLFSFLISTNIAEVEKSINSFMEDKEVKYVYQSVWMDNLTISVWYKNNLTERSL
jgi:hypothetical protein